MPHKIERMNSAPIGVFDSGVGGLTVAREIHSQLPRESILYVADTANQPYGPKSIDEIRESSFAVMDRLVADGVKVLVIACNSATAASFSDARERYDVPVVEVIRPAVRGALTATRSGRIGVLATAATVRSGAYQRAFAEADANIDLTLNACPRFVEFVERGDTTSPELVDVTREYLAPLNDANVDTIVLGCTHYPFLKGVISYVAGQDTALVSNDVETANDLYRTLISHDLLAPDGAEPEMSYRTTGDDIDEFKTLARTLLGPAIENVRRLQEAE